MEDSSGFTWMEVSNLILAQADKYKSKLRIGTFINLDSDKQTLKAYKEASSASQWLETSCGGIGMFHRSCGNLDIRKPNLRQSVIATGVITLRGKMRYQ